MNIQPFEIATQLVVFLTLLAVLRAFVFNPLLHLHRLRLQATQGKEDEAKELIERAQVLVRQYDQSIEEMHAEANRKLQFESNAGTQQAKVLVAQARQQAQEMFAEKKHLIHSERERLQTELQKQAQQLAHEIVEHVVP